MKAHDRRDLLAPRAATRETVAAAVEEVRRVLRKTAMERADQELLRSAEQEAYQSEFASSHLESCWDSLVQRQTLPELRQGLDEMRPRLAVGLCNSSDISAATYAFDDGSYLLLFDEGLSALVGASAELAVLGRQMWVYGVEPPAPPIPPSTIARALRLLLSWYEIRDSVRALPLLLNAIEARIAGELQHEMLMFLLAHEVAHVSYNEVNKQGLFLIGSDGEPVPMGKSLQEEYFADEMAVRLIFEDFRAGDLDPWTIFLRANAVRLALVMIETFERQYFVLQPAGHPAAGERWARVEKFFPALRRTISGRSLLDFSQSSVDALAALEPFHPLGAEQNDADVVGDDLSRWMVKDWWELDVEAWREVWVLAGLEHIGADMGAAILHDWAGWKTDPAPRVEWVLKSVLETPDVQAALREALAGETALTYAGLNRLIHVHAPAADLLGSDEPFPCFAIAAICREYVLSKATPVASGLLQPH